MKTWRRPNTSSSPSAPNTRASLVQIWCPAVLARVCSKTSRPPNSGRTVRLHPRWQPGKTLNGLSSRSNCSRPRHITGTCTSSTWKGPLSAGASTPPAWTGCWSMRRRPLKSASTTSSSEVFIWPWPTPCASKVTPCSTSRPRNIPRRWTPAAANCWSSAFATPKKTAKTGLPTPRTKPRWSACQSCSARPPWSWASIFRP